MLANHIKAIRSTTPDAFAVIAEDGALTYQELDDKSDRTAAALVRLGIKKGQLVAIYTPRTVLALVSLVGVMKAGAAYTVVEDEGMLDEHLHRLSQINPNLILSTPSRLSQLQEQGFRAVDANFAGEEDTGLSLPHLSLDDTAYVLFTSGSTGRPKGVEVSHGNVEHYVSAISKATGISHPLRYAHVSTLAADLGNTSLFLALSTGGCVHLIGPETRKDPTAFRGYLERHLIDFLKITPSHWSAIFPLGTGQSVDLPQLQYLIFGGEALPVGLASAILQTGRINHLFNHYGPTETTIGVTLFQIQSERLIQDQGKKNVPIGTALGQTKLVVENEAGELKDRDTQGELLVGGPSVSKGYRANASATAKAFVNLADYSQSERFYRTGDFVEIDGEGVVHFLGRVDRQVKINGYRVELEHIESVLRTLQDVEDAAVFLIEVQGKPQIVASIISARHGESLGWLRRQLVDVLPPYMAPKTCLYMVDFPRNANGKTDLKRLRQEVEHRLLQEASYQVTTPDDHDTGPTNTTDQIRHLFRTYLRTDQVNDRDDFFEIGGDSLDAIQLMAELQLRGLNVTTHAFLKQPTIEGLAAAIKDAEPDRQPLNDSKTHYPEHLSPAQDFFFKQSLANSDHFNQAMLFETTQSVDVEGFHYALEQVIQAHPTLRTAYRSMKKGLSIIPCQLDTEEASSVSLINWEAESATDCHVETVAQYHQKSISLREGRLFRAHLFRSSCQRDLILFVAHHVAVDVISWRILVADFSRIYAEWLHGRRVQLPYYRHSFWGWTQHLLSHKHQLFDRARDWLERLESHLDNQELFFSADNLEETANTVWISLSHGETQALQSFSMRNNRPLHQLVLAAFSHALTHIRPAPSLVIEVESHGRVTLSDDIDTSRVIGWHTSTFPFIIERTATWDETLQSVIEESSRLPDLGVAYGLIQQDQTNPHPHSPICFNFLGDVNFNSDERFELKPSRCPIGRPRDGLNNRVHDLKLTAKIVDGHLAADLSFSQNHTLAEVSRLLTTLYQSLLALSGDEPRELPHFLVEEGTRTGSINYVPRELVHQKASSSHREYNAVLLTGATGFMGSFILKELIEQSDAHVYCLVRAKGGDSAKARLQENLQWYFEDSPWIKDGSRFTVVEGDMSQHHFGLAPDKYAHLTRECDAIFHFAADTRLFGSEEEFERTNIDPVKTCLRFATDQRSKDMHYMSTLAVCGVNNHPELIEFSEDSLDVGQEFQNFYEATKFRAERLVNDHQMAGHPAFIYRSGNVSGHSQSARFQRNGDQNRFVQFLKSVTKLGRIPQELGDPIALSPVDQVAQGIVSIALDSRTKGGVFHVDTPHSISMRRVFDRLQHQGFPLVNTSHTSFSAIFSEDIAEEDRDIALGRFWAARKPRNITFNHERTLTLLERLDCRFNELDDYWLDRFIRGLVDADHFVKRVESNTQTHSAFATL